MATYKAYLSQGEGNGCDYTIGCGHVVRNIQAASLEEAKQKLIEIISEEYSYSEGRLLKAELYEVEQVFVMNIHSIYEKIENDKELERQKEITENEQKEFERLKAKFG